MPEHSKLVLLKLRNLGCIGPEGLEVELDDIVCLVGRNNVGKSTVIRSYELAQGSKQLSEHDKCQWTPEGDWPEVELSVHIPDRIPNIDPKWKIDIDGLKIVRSRWQWKESGKPVRQTWDPTVNEGAGDWAEDGKAGGADNVFNSRLPKPLRVDALKDASVEHDELLQLITEPVAKELKQLQNDKDSALRRAVTQFVDAAMAPVMNYQESVNRVGEKVQAGFSGTFPELNLEIKIGMQPPNIDAARALREGSSIRFLEGKANTGLKQQGNGSRRALFWTLLQVRNALVREQEASEEKIKRIAKLNKQVDTERNKKKPDEQKLDSLMMELETVQASTGEVEDDVALPGYILLIDEPENCLHPMAVRAASAHLYALARDENWQVMLSTHSPYFIDPLADHTTIVRLERDDGRTTPSTYRTDKIAFAEEERENLRALLQMDTSLAEMFFGSYPIVVEGDTEVAAYIAAECDRNPPLKNKVVIIPARGKALIVPLVKLLTHFKISFGVLHDTDAPNRSDNATNGAWTENKKIASAIVRARENGIHVRHRISLPDFERSLGAEEGSKDKPLLVYHRIRGDELFKLRMQRHFEALYQGTMDQPIETLTNVANADDIFEAIRLATITWASENAPNDPRFHFE